MTTPEFLRLLANIRDQFDWSLTADTGQHAERRKNPRFHLNGTPTSHPALSLGPLQALCFVRTGEVLPLESLADTSSVLDMDPEEVHAIAAAADDRTWAGPAGQRTPVQHLLNIRRQLLEAVGIIPVAGNQVASG